MPRYLYQCPICMVKREEIHGMDTLTSVMCDKCNTRMLKKPQSVAVSWNGNRPSDGGVTPLVQHMIADAPRQRDILQAKKGD